MRTIITEEGGVMNDGIHDSYIEQRIHVDPKVDTVTWHI